MYLIQGHVFDIKLHKPDVQEHIASYYAFVDQNEVLTPTTMSHTPASRRGPGFVHDSPFVELSPTGRSTIPIGDPAGAINWTPRSGDGLAVRNSRYDNSRLYDSRFNSQNHVDIDRIRMGVDVRTTVSCTSTTELDLITVANYFFSLVDHASQYSKQDRPGMSAFSRRPSRLAYALIRSQAMLKDIVDDTSFGKYDFMYLRIGKSPLLFLQMSLMSFANSCFRFRQQLQVS